MLTRHIDHHQNPEKLLVVSGTSPYMFSTFDFEAPDSGLVPRRFTRPFDAKAKVIGFVTSFHGLVCLGIARKYYHYTYSDLILWNPLTSDYKTLSKTNSHKYCYYINDLTTSGLLYNSCEDDYKLVRVVSRRHIVFIYSLRSDSCRRVYSLQCNLNIASGSQSICLNGNLYFGTLESRYRNKYSITRFDTNTEKLEEIKVPSVDDIHDLECATLMVQGGCLHLFSTYADGRTGFKEKCIQLWKMIEDGCWNNVLTFHVDWYYDFYSPLLRDGKFLIIRNAYSLCSDDIYEVDMKNMQHSKGKEKWCNVYSTHSTLHGRQQVRYIETFVSPNLYSK